MPICQPVHYHGDYCYSDFYHHVLVLPIHWYLLFFFSVCVLQVFWLLACGLHAILCLTQGRPWIVTFLCWVSHNKCHKSLIGLRTYSKIILILNFDVSYFELVFIEHGPKNSSHPFVSVPGMGFGFLWMCIYLSALALNVYHSAGCGFFPHWDAKLRKIKTNKTLCSCKFEVLVNNKKFLVRVYLKYCKRHTQRFIIYWNFKFNQAFYNCMWKPYATWIMIH